MWSISVTFPQVVRVLSEKTPKIVVNIMTEDFLTSAFVKFRQRLSTVARRIVGNDDDAADVLQESFCRLWGVRDSFRSESHATGAAMTTVKNMSIDHLRRTARQTTVDVEGIDMVDDSSELAADRERLLAEVDQIVESHLSESQRAILRLREHENLSLEEIADRLQMNPSTVRVSLSRARNKIREIYKKQYSND